MDPILVRLGPLAVRWYGALIATGVLFGTLWAVRWARQRKLDPDRLLDMGVWLVLGGLVGARLVYVLTSPSAFFGPSGDPLRALAVWQGGISIHGGVAGVVLATWLYCRRYGLNMWAYLDVMTPVGALGIIGGRLGNIMNGSDTTGRLTGWPIGFTWPDAGAPFLGGFGRTIFGTDLWAYYPGTCSLGSDVSLEQCAALGGSVLRGPVHFTQLYGVFIGIALIPIIIWAFRRARASGYVFWQFVLWYSVLRAVVEEPFRDNPVFLAVFLAEGPSAPGIGLFTLTQLVSVILVALALVMLRRSAQHGSAATAESRTALRRNVD
jgi:phosphatidylglycerol:prolipoprotein diacylglycerol transferase